MMCSRRRRFQGRRPERTAQPHPASSRRRRDVDISTMQLVRQVRKLAQPWPHRLQVRPVQERPRVVRGRPQAQPRLQCNNLLN